MKHTLTFLFLILFTSQVFSQQIGDTLKVELTRHIGPGPFQQSMSVFRPTTSDETDRFYNLHERATGLPEKYTTLEIGTLPSDFRQMAFSAIKRGILDSADYYKGWFSNSSPEELAEMTKAYINTEVSIAYGIIDFKPTLIIDSNNNEDFSDDPVIELDPDALTMKAFSNPPMYSALVERYNQKEIVTDSTYFTFLPLEQMGRIYMSTSDYRSGEFEVNGKKHFVFVNNSFYGIQYTPATLKLIYDTKPYDENMTRPNRDSYLSTHDFIIGEDFDYKIADIDLEGIL